MGVALTLAEKENRSFVQKDGLRVRIVDRFSGGKSDARAPADAADGSATTSESIVLYTELMRCLINDGGGDDNMLLKVFLVFQEMRNAGATPDVACYNSLLRACALSGDMAKAGDILRRMRADDIEPNRNTLRGALKATRKTGRSVSVFFVAYAGVCCVVYDVWR